MAGARWRVGSRVPVNLYKDDIIAGQCQSPELADELVHAVKQVAHLEAALAAERKRTMDWENREAAVCPEDVGFEERIRALTDERDDYRALRKDKERLDWLDENRWDLQFGYSSNFHANTAFLYNEPEVGKGKTAEATTLRDAIDAAIQASSASHAPDQPSGSLANSDPFTR